MTMSTGPCEAFVSAPIKLAARISERRGRGQSLAGQTISKSRMQCNEHEQLVAMKARQLVQASRWGARRACATRLGLLLGCCLLSLAPIAQAHLQQHPFNSQLINHDDATLKSGARDQSSMLRHHAHYLNFVPSAHFSYNEGRQMGARSLELDSGSSVASEQQQVVSGSHIYKRSSAVLIGGGLAKNPPQSARAALNPLSRRMMASGGVQSAKLVAESSPTTSSVKRQSNWLGVGAPASGALSDPLQAEGSQVRERIVASPADGADQSQEQEQRDQPTAVASSKRQSEQEAELLRQKQHIQYHDQWPSMAGKCHKRTLNFCASVLPFNTTTFPNIIGDTTRFEVKRSLPFFGFLAKSSCNKRLDELLCLLLEPPCSTHSGAAIPPCKKFCRLALEGCNEYIPATLALSSVFDCRQYPDSTDPSVCVNLAQGSKCAQDEFKCPDKTCIPRNWLCDGVRDCIFAADEANCTDSAAVPQASVCSTEEFKCDGKCVPKAWKCDGERDCLDGSDEESCDLRPRCGPDRFKCADGNGCIPKRWICDGKAECRDGSDEMNCNQRECSENDFKCDNGICIPKLWRCDRQFDCKDGSDERQCVYPTPSTTTTTTTTATAAPTSETAITTTQTSAAETLGAESIQLNVSSSHGFDLSQVTPSAISVESAEQAADQSAAGSTRPQESNQVKQQFELNLMSDISRFIQHERDSAQQRPAPTTTSVASSSTIGELVESSSSSETSPQDSQQQVLPSTSTTKRQQFESSESSPRPPVDVNSNQQVVGQQQLAGELRRLNYDLIPPAANMVQVSNEPVAKAPSGGGVEFGRFAPNTNQPAPMVTQFDFVPQQQETQPQRPRPVFAPHQRIPIYRSLFKSLKGHHQAGQVHLSPQNGLARNVVAVARRRRDRHHLQQLQQQRRESSFGQIGDGSNVHQAGRMMLLPTSAQLSQVQLNQTFAWPTI